MSIDGKANPMLEDHIYMGAIIGGLVVMPNWM